MSKKRYIDTHFWNDGWVTNDLDKDDRYFFLYLLTNDKTNVAGVYEIPLKTMANDTDLTREEVLAILKKLESRVVHLNGWIILRKAIKHQNYRNEKIQKAIELVLDSCPQALLTYIEKPVDFEYTPRLKMTQQSLMDDTLHSNLNSNLIKSNSEPALRHGPNKFGGDKKTYAKAVRADEALTEKELRERARPKTDSGTKSGYEIAQEQAKRLKEKRAIA